MSKNDRKSTPPGCILELMKHSLLDWHNLGFFLRAAAKRNGLGPWLKMVEHGPSEISCH